MSFWRFGILGFLVSGCYSDKKILEPSLSHLFRPWHLTALFIVIALAPESAREMGLYIILYIMLIALEQFSNVKHCIFLIITQMFLDVENKEYHLLYVVFPPIQIVIFDIFLFGWTDFYLFFHIKRWCHKWYSGPSTVRPPYWMAAPCYVATICMHY